MPSFGDSWGWGAVHGEVGRVAWSKGLGVAGLPGPLPSQVLLVV